MLGGAAVRPARRQVERVAGREQLARRRLEALEHAHRLPERNASAAAARGGMTSRRSRRGPARGRRRSCRRARRRRRPAARTTPSRRRASSAAGSRRSASAAPRPAARSGLPAADRPAAVGQRVERPPSSNGPWRSSHAPPDSLIARDVAPASHASASTSSGASGHSASRSSAPKRPRTSSGDFCQTSVTKRSVVRQGSGRSTRGALRAVDRVRDRVGRDDFATEL